MSRVLCTVLLVVCCVVGSSTVDNTYKGNEITYKISEDGSVTAIVLYE